MARSLGTGREDAEAMHRQLTAAAARAEYGLLVRYGSAPRRQVHSSDQAGGEAWQLDGTGQGRDWRPW